MIPRYEQKEISKLWEDNFKFSYYLKIEVALLHALEKHKRIPNGTSKKFSNIKISPERIGEIEEKTKHDVIAFCTSITEQLPSEISKYFHFGVTSSDIIDSALTLQIKDSLDTITPQFKNLLKTLYNKSVETKDILAMGRSHGMNAEPMSFGQKILGHFCEFQRRFEDLISFYNNELTLQLSGAVGNYTVLTPEIENDVAKTLELKVEPVSTQVIPRDRIGKLVNIISLTASAIERLSVEIRHLHHSDIGEVFEGFSKGQKGSSAMPHKKNPISTENLTGIARILRSHSHIALENVVLWHERDISHSSAERIYLPDLFGLFHYSLKRLTHVIENLVINKKHIEEKVFKNTSYLSSYYLHFLIENSELTRESLYEIVQTAAFDTQDKGLQVSLQAQLEKHKIKHHYNLDMFNADCKNIKEFHKKAQDLYNRDFLKIKLSESICAIAKPLADNLKFVLTNCILKMNNYQR